ncbi:MmcQ/YjbR family DNA-binding protein [Dysgonomonas sp. HGC4]|uniref:MmcQ/YjbR family DNA-binding protein n=1 Tax=Dysgonomonas sp. HGC4 TaxID=1658009 RepID=UPI0006824BC3|nr:MmcQ/YjbR family DNA-binding protein [Dysgonomonas sp. HGC4]MBD8349615.1 MmcQ/YjbR family DNA-binding protein [Dysgonomonas sp. HGC4]
MNIEDVREYCLSVKGAEECFPFDETTIVFKVMGKMFAYMGLERRDDGFLLNLKCDPEKAIELREKYECVIPGYHSNKKYWNSIFIEQNMPDDELKYWVNHSVEEVIKKLPKKQQAEYAEMKSDSL